MVQVRRYFYVLVAMLLAGCGSTPVEKSTQTRLTSAPARISTQATEPDIDDFLKKAKRASSFQQIQWLLKVAQAEQTESCEKSIAIVNVLLPELSQIEDITLAHLIKVECYLSLAMPNQALALQDKLLFQMGLDERIHQANSHLYEFQEKWLDAAHSAVLSDLDEQQKANRVWKLIAQLPPSKLNVTADYQRLIPWIELNQLVRRYGAQPAKFDQQLLQWQARYPALPIPDVSNIQVGRQLTALAPNHIGIVLPLTGRNEAQGQAIKNGILAAYINYVGTPPKLTFYDSNLTEFSETFFETQQIDALIGPLLKESIPLIEPLLPSEFPFLALNRLEEGFETEQNNTSLELPGTAKQHYYFALAPEDEAAQLADVLYDDGYRSPLVVATSASISARMLEQFNHSWAKRHGMSPEYVVVGDTQSMRETLAQAFSFADSEQRIKQIEDLMREKLHSEKRNRQDLDAVVILANSAQTELLNPIIESNISPFADPIPVFASSRSFRTDMSENALRDFRNVSFTEMPWMLPNNPWRLLRQRVDKLWPNQPDINTRLFGMGYDAFNLLPIMQFMALYPGWCYSGLTGELCMDSQGQIQRTLPLGKIDGTQVLNLGMVK